MKLHLYYYGILVAEFCAATHSSRALRRAAENKGYHREGIRIYPAFGGNMNENDLKVLS